MAILINLLPSDHFPSSAGSELSSESQRGGLKPSPAPNGRLTSRELLNIAESALRKPVLGARGMSYVPTGDSTL